MADYAFVVGATRGYTPELCALLNSLDFVGNKQDMHVLGINLPKEMTDQFWKLGYKVILHDIQEKEWEEARGRSEVVCRKRYWYAAEIGQAYKAVCVLDADLIFCRDPIQFFEIAGKTDFILGPTKEQNKVYDDPHHMVDGTWIIPSGTYNDKDMCNCPVFFDARIWGKAFARSWDIFLNHDYKAPDMDAMNMCLLEAGAYHKIVRLAGLQWLGTNEQLLKPYIRAVERRGKIYTECGLEIYSYHGQYYYEKWRNCQLENRHHCAEGYLKATECSDNMAQGALNLLTENFNKMLDHNIKIEKLDYRSLGN